MPSGRTNQKYIFNVVKRVTADFHTLATKNSVAKEEVSI